MAKLRTKFEEFIADPKRRRVFERESLAFEAAELISGLMEQRQVSKTELAERIGASKSHVTQLLTGSRNMTMHTLADLAFALGHKVEIGAHELDALAFDTLDGREEHAAEFHAEVDRFVEAYQQPKPRKASPACIEVLDPDISVAA
ncbi:MAG: helix-turn-helix transcriptional regulator [Acidobacteria bacterium]|nr:helix-turn-helix transcriptional regulator [Acidobacteriota bacterium]